MKIISLFLILFGCCQYVSAQVSGQLTSTVGQPIPFANVLLVKIPDSTLVSATLTDEHGGYKLETNVAGTYVLKVSSLGYRNWQSPAFALTANRPAKDLGNQIMLEDARQLNEVTIRGQKPLFEQTAEGTVVNVESSLLSKGSSVLQILERSPGVTIDYRNNGIALNGKSGVTIMLNGKLMRVPIEQVVTLLNGMSANEITTIELLTAPGARYDAEGSAGIINIVLKNNRTGDTKPRTTGTATLTGGYGWAEKINGSVNLSHNTEKVSLYGSYSFLHDRSYSYLYIDSWQNMPVLGGQLYVSVNDTTKVVQNNHDATLGVDITLTPKTTIGANMAWNSSKRNATNTNGSSYTIFPDSVLLFDGRINGTNRWQNWVNSVYLETKLREGETFNAAVDYIHFSSNNPSEVQSTFLTTSGEQAGNNDSLFAPRQRGFANTVILVGVGKVDYSRQISPKWKLEAGLKGTYTQNRSGAGIESLIDGIWVSRTETADEIIMREPIGAAYVSANAQLNPRLNLVVGMRYENARTQMNNAKTCEYVVDRRLGVLFPNVALSKKLTDQSEVQLSYTKRISRPSFSDLASFIRYSDPSAVYTGNPFLKPTITNNLTLGYTYRGYSFSVLFSRDDNPIARYQLTEAPARNLLYVGPQNLSWQKNITLQATIPLKVTSWWDMSYGFIGGLRVFSVEHTRIPIQKSYFGYSANMSQTFKLSRGFSAELSGWYNAVSYNGSIKVGSMGAINFGLRKELKNTGGKLQLAVTDLLQTMRIDSYYGAITEEAFSIQNHVRFNTESRVFTIVKFTYTKSFGRISTSNQAKGNAGSKDEQERLQKN